MNESLIGQIPGEFARSTGSSGDETSERAARSTKRRLAFTLSILLSAAYALPFVERGWIPHDEGTIAQSAERVLSGELPHRDFDEGYTGGLTWAHALTFRILGTRLASLRWLLYVSFLFWVAAVAAIAMGVVSPGAAFLVTLLAVVWSVPNYFASLPSWYNLFFATFGTLALFRHGESGRKTWLWIAGLCGGLSILVKIVGLYYVAAVLLYVVHYKETLSESEPRRPRRERSAFLIITAFGAAVLMGLVVLVFVRPPFLFRRLMTFAFPPATLIAAMLYREWRSGSGRSRERFFRLSSLLLPFCAGVSIPLAIYVLPYVATGSLNWLARDLFVLPQRQIAKATVALPAQQGVWLAIIALIVLLRPVALPARARRAVHLALAAVLVLILCLSGSFEAYQTLWSNARALAVATPLAAALLVSSPLGAGVSVRRQHQVFLLGSLSAFLPLVQFPFSAAIYFCYAAPIVVLALVAIAAARPGGSKTSRLALLIVFLAFAVLRMNPGYLFNLGWRAARYSANGRLEHERGGLRVPVGDARDYGALLAALRRVAPEGEIYASPDCPEVYFLAGRRNPTRYFFDFLSDDYGQPDRMIRLLKARDVQAVVLNDLPSFSRRPNESLRRAIADRYPHSERIGRFTLFWRDGSRPRPAYNPAP